MVRAARLDEASLRLTRFDQETPDTRANVRFQERGMLEPLDHAERGVAVRALPYAARSEQHELGRTRARRARDRGQSRFHVACIEIRDDADQGWL